MRRGIVVGKERALGAWKSRVFREIQSNPICFEGMTRGQFHQLEVFLPPQDEKIFWRTN